MPRSFGFDAESGISLTFSIGKYANNVSQNYFFKAFEQLAVLCILVNASSGQFSSSSALQFVDLTSIEIFALAKAMLHCISHTCNYP